MPDCPHALEAEHCVDCSYPDAYIAACLLCDAGSDIQTWGWFYGGMCLRCRNKTEDTSKEFKS